MHIRSVFVENIRCFDRAEIDFSAKDGVRDWTLVLGDNGVGKTSMLRSIAMGLCDASSASALMSEIYGEWVREGAKEGMIRIDLEREDSPLPVRIETRIERLRSGESKVHQITTPSDEFPWEDIFVCAYGAARRTFGTKDYPEYSSVDSVYSLFNYDSALQNPELIMRRIESTGVKLETVLRLIDRVLMLPEGSTALDNSGIKVSGPWGQYRPLGSLGDGYQATLAWIVDLLGWALFYDPTMLSGEISGIVLLDELEQHLHPRWQRQIVQLLSQQFPEVQFITSTHAPLCAIGSAALPEEECGIVLLSQQRMRVDVSPVHPPPKRQRADQVLTSYLFQLETASDDETQFQIERFSKLLSTERNQAQERELRQIRAQLDQKLGSGGTDLERRVAQAVQNVLLTQPEAQFHPDVIDYEVKRQLHELLS